MFSLLSSRDLRKRTKIQYLCRIGQIGIHRQPLYMKWISLWLLFAREEFRLLSEEVKGLSSGSDAF